MNDCVALPVGLGQLVCITVTACPALLVPFTISGGNLPGLLGSSVFLDTPVLVVVTVNVPFLLIPDLDWADNIVFLFMSGRALLGGLPDVDSDAEVLEMVMILAVLVSSQCMPFFEGPRSASSFSFLLLLELFIPPRHGFRFEKYK